MKLDREESKKLHKALLSAFPGKGALEQMVRFQLGEHLEAIAGGENYSNIVFNLIKWAESRGKLKELVIGAHNENQTNPELALFVALFNTRREPSLEEVSMFKPPADSQPNQENNMTGLIKISGCDNPSRRGDIVFVHGLAGHAWNTWHWQNPNDRNYQKDDFWLTWLGKDLIDVGIWTFGYRAARFKTNSSAMPLFDQASTFLEYLVTSEPSIGEKPLVFVTHSMGGLLVKKMLNSVEDYLGDKNKKAVLESTGGIVFLSTPHLGSEVAQWLKAFNMLTTVNVQELEANDDELRRLDQWYRQKVDKWGIKTKVYYEKQPTAGFLIVNEGSANPGIKDVQPVAIDADHNYIAKPDSRKSIVYVGVKKFIQECLPSQNQKSLPPANNPVSLRETSTEETANPYQPL